MACRAAIGDRGGLVGEARVGEGRLEETGRPTPGSGGQRAPRDGDARRDDVGVERDRVVPTSRRQPPSRMLAGLDVLVVDDDAETATLFQTVLTVYGASVTMAANARQALILLAEQPPDVVLTDIAMPGEDGYWLLQQIRSLTDLTVSRLPVVAATAYGWEHSRARTLAAGFAEHLQKPVDPEQLCRAVARAAGR